MTPTYSIELKSGAGFVHYINCKDKKQGLEFFHGLSRIKHSKFRLVKTTKKVVKK